MPGIANRQWYSVERYTSQALPSAPKRAIGLLSTRCDGYDAALAAAEAKRANILAQQRGNLPIKEQLAKAQAFVDLCSNRADTENKKSAKQIKTDEAPYKVSCD